MSTLITDAKFAILTFKNTLHLETFRNATELAEQAILNLRLEMIPEAHVEWAQRMVDLVREFRDIPPSGDYKVGIDVVSVPLKDIQDDLNVGATATPKARPEPRYVVAKQHPTEAHVSMFLTDSERIASEHEGTGWTVLQIDP